LVLIALLIATHQDGVETTVLGQPESPLPIKPGTIRVYMMEMWSFIPYYVGRLCAALADESVEATLGSVRYHLDRGYFHKQGLVPDRVLLDTGGRFGSTFLRRFVKSCEYLANLFLLAVRFAVSRPDILHVQYLPLLEHGLGLEVWFLKWVRRLGIRLVYTVHNVTHPDAPKKGIQLFRRAYNSADALICHGKEAQLELLNSLGIPAEKIWVIPHGPLFEAGPQVSPEEARSALRVKGEGPLVLWQGVISPYKGVLFLLDAWKRVPKLETQAKLLIAGTGDPRVMSQISEKIAAEGIESSVDFWPRFVPVEQLPLLYQAADILVYPYMAGTTSGALLTGMNYGKAIVATRLPFFQEYLKDGETALLVDYGDTDALASSLQALVQYPEERARIANALHRRTSQAISWQEIARKTRDCYEVILRKSGT
jgi:glycosyltransferase involved in cell wall biosynthesis